MHVAILYAAALVSGYLMSLLRVPLPWMIGPMVLAAAIVSLAGKTPTIPWITRPIGQLVVAASVGLFFTPAALALVSQQIVLMIAVAVLTIAAGFLAALVLVWLANIDVVSASLASEVCWSPQAVIVLDKGQDGDSFDLLSSLATHTAYHDDRGAFRARGGGADAQDAPQNSWRM